MEYIPNGNVFLVGAVIILLSAIPFALAAAKKIKSARSDQTA